MHTTHHDPRSTRIGQYETKCRNCAFGPRRALATWDKFRGGGGFARLRPHDICGPNPSGRGWWALKILHVQWLGFPANGFHHLRCHNAIPPPQSSTAVTTPHVPSLEPKKHFWPRPGRPSTRTRPVMCSGGSRWQLERPSQGPLGPAVASLWIPEDLPSPVGTTDPKQVSSRRPAAVTLHPGRTASTDAHEALPPHATRRLPRPTALSRASIRGEAEIGTFLEAVGFGNSSSLGKNNDLKTPAPQHTR
jgi:hypothetical protein